MARRARQTRPLATRSGILQAFVEIEPLLIEGELRGRRWAHQRAVPGVRGEAPRDADLFELHEAMFAEVLTWAGRPRNDARGPGGVEHAAAHMIRVEMRNLAEDLRAWIAAAGDAPTVATLGALLAHAHHRFQWIHPFEDTNGRTGRVLDHYLLWVTFGLATPDLASSPVLMYFPTSAYEDQYYDGLAEADNYRPEPLRAYYADRLQNAIEESPLGVGSEG